MQEESYKECERSHIRSARGFILEGVESLYLKVSRTYIKNVDKLTISAQKSHNRFTESGETTYGTAGLEVSLRLWRFTVSHKITQNGSL